MPIYKVGDKKYNVPQEELEGFLAEFPQAEEFTEGKTSTTEPDTTVDATEVSDTESLSADGSLELEETKYKTPLTLEEKKSLQNNQFAKQMAKEDNFTKERLTELKQVDKNPYDILKDIKSIDEEIELIAGEDMLVDPLDSPKRIKQYNELALKRNSKLKEAKDKISDRGTFSSIYQAFKQGDSNLGEMLLSVPSFFYEVGALFSDPVNRALGLPETDLKKFEESIGTRPLLDELIAEQENLSKQREIYKDIKSIKGDAYSNLSKGNFEDGFYLLGESLAESAPVSISLMMGGAAGLSRAALTLGGGVPLAAGELRTQQEEYPDQSREETLLKSSLIGMSEGFFEGILGAGALGGVYKNIIKKQGLEQGGKTFKDGLVTMYQAALEKYGVPVALVGNGFEEAATQATQNVVNGKPISEGVANAFTVGLGSGGVYGAPVNIAKGVQYGKETLQKVNVNKLIKKTKYTSVSEAFNPEIKTEDTQIKLSQNPNTIKVLDQQLKNQVSKGEKTQEEADAIALNFRQTQGTANSIKPLKLSDSDQATTVELLKEKKQLTEEIKQVGEPNLTIEQSDRIKQIDEDLKGIGSKAVTQEVEKVKKAAESIKDLDVQEFASTQETEAFLSEQGQDTKASGQQGFIIQDPNTGKQTIVINREIADKEIAVAAPSHEFLHALLFQTVKDSPETQVALGNSLKEYINKIDANKVQDSNFVKRLEQYKSDPEAVQAEEVLTLFSDAIRTEDIKFNETVFTKIGDVVRKALQALGVKVKFNNGKDVYNFIKDYNKSLESTGLTKAQIKAAEGVTGKLVADKVQTDEQIIKESRSEEASARVQELYDTQGEAAAFDIIEQFKPITSKIVEKRSEAPGFDRQLLTDEIETGERGILDLIKEYKPEMKTPLAAWINKFLPARAIEASKRILGEEFTEDVTEAKGVAAEEASIEVAKTEKQATSKLRRVLGIKQGDDIYNLAKEVSGEILSGDLPGKKVKTTINREARKSKLRKAVSDLMGTEKAIDEQFLNKNILEILKALPASDLVKLERESKVKVLAEQGPRLNVKDAREAVNKGLLPKDTNLQSGPKVSFKLPTTLEQAKEFFTQKRKAGLVNVVTEMLVKDAAPEVTKGKMDLAIRAKVLSEIDRAPELKFSKKSKQVEKQFAKTPELKPGFSGKKAPTSQGEYTSSKTGEVKNYVKINENSDDFKVITETLNSFLDKHDEYYPYFRYSTTGTRGTTFENIDKFNEYINKKEAKVKVPRKKYHKNNFLDKGLLSNVLKTLDSDNKAKLDLLQDIFLDIESFLNSKQGKDKAWVFEQVLLDAQKDQNHFLRILVPFGFYPVDLKTGKPLYNFKATEEHADPAVQVGRQLLTAAINGNVKEAMKVVRATSMQGSLLKLDDDSLKPLGLNSDMPKAYFDIVVPLILEGKLDFLPDGFASLIRYTANNNINPFQYQIAGSNQTIGEFFLGKIDTANMKNMLRFSPTTLEISSIANKLITSVITGEIDIKTAKQRFQSNQKIVPTVVKASKSNNDKSAFKFSKTPTNEVTIDAAARTDKALDNARDLNAPVKKIRVFDFDDTLAQTKSDVLYTMPDGTEGKLNAEQFARDGGTLLSEGAVFDFSEFNKVTEGKKGPLFKVAQTIAAKRGTEDVFVLTARAPESQLAIYEFLKSQGLNIPLKNITGLGDSTGDAKARWIVDKAADGYNDFYFADDAFQNVKAVKDALSVLDVKSKTQQAKIKFSKSLDLNKDFNDIIENKTGIASDKTYARVKAEVAGANKGKFNFFIPPSAEDFVGLLYSTLGKGDVGDAQMAWYKSHLLNPFARAMENIANDRVAIIQDYKGLKKALKIVPKDLRKKVPGEPFTREQAVRVYIWDQQGMEIPGLSKKDQSDLVKYVNENAELTVFADQLIAINKGDEYASPDAGWIAGTIDTDFLKALNTTKRAKYLEVWQQNVDEIFSETNLNKLEAAYGKPYRVAMENILHRMKTGRNRSFGTDTITGRFTDWLTNSVGAIMFFNTRSAVLQTISAVNFINFSDNNVLRAGQAFANQPQYWSDFKKLFNSPFLLDRRSGIKLNVNEADIAEMAKGPGNSARNVIAGLLKAGFLPTQLADSFAIASGGATFYRNRIKALKKEGLTEAEAEEIAFRDFREIAEESQQSSRPDKISQQQAGPLGRVVLAFANTPAQYARLIKKAASDLKNGRGDAKTNISKIIYYGVAQNVLFSALQQALFAVSFGDDEEEEKKRDEKYFNIANGMADSILRGIGVGGAIASVVKNTAIKLAKEEEKRSPKYQDVLVKEVLQISPPISSKVGKLRSAGRSLSWNKKEMMTKGWSIDNPAYLASANVISAVTNLPADRAVKKITNLVDANNEEIEYYKRIALALGWSSWELGIDKKDKKKPESSTGKTRTRTRRITRTKKRRN